MLLGRLQQRGRSSGEGTELQKEGISGFWDSPTASLGPFSHL